MQKTGQKKIKNALSKPEKQVERDVLIWAFQNRFLLHVFDSKAIYSKRFNGYRENPNMPLGCPDLIGVAPDGTACMIELKAKGKLKTLRPSQYNFLYRAIEHNAFAVVVDSKELLNELWSTWSKTRSQAYLHDHLKAQLKICAFPEP